MDINQLADNCYFRYRAYNENTLREILNLEIWHSKSEYLNDPYELGFDFDWDQLNQENFYDICKNFPPFSQEEIIQKAIIQNQTDIYLERIKLYLSEALSSLMSYHKKAFICCFCKEYQDALMWSHYADGMRGICIAYDKNELCSNPQFSTIVPVEYNDTYKHISYKDIHHFINNPPKAFHQLFFTKSFGSRNPLLQRSFTMTSYIEGFKHVFQKHTRWEYEKEYRHILLPEAHEEGLPGVIEIAPKNAIKAIIVGSKMNPINLKVIEMICKEREIQMFKASPNLKDYSVHIEMHKF